MRAFPSVVGRHVVAHGATKRVRTTWSPSVRVARVRNNSRREWTWFVPICTRQVMTATDMSSRSPRDSTPHRSLGIELRNMNTPPANFC